MKNLLIITVALLVANPVFSQTRCDTNAIEQIINKQLKITDKWFKKPYTICPSSGSKNSANYLKPDSLYNTLCCGKELNWNSFNITSKHSRVVNNQPDYMAYFLFISTPIFNEDGTKCKFIVSSHLGEWGGASYMYYYKKKGNRWKVDQSRVVTMY